MENTWPPDPFAIKWSKSVKRRSYIKETWKADYVCKSCGSSYTQTNKAANQKRICPQCRKMNTPSKEVKKITITRKLHILL